MSVTQTSEVGPPSVPIQRGCPQGHLPPLRNQTSSQDSSISFPPGPSRFSLPLYCGIVIWFCDGGFVSSGVSRTGWVAVGTSESETDGRRGTP